jgi:hypothetical protein
MATLHLSLSHKVGRGTQKIEEKGIPISLTGDEKDENY